MENPLLQSEDEYTFMLGFFHSNNSSPLPLISQLLTPSCYFCTFLNDLSIYTYAFILGNKRGLWIFMI